VFFNEKQITEEKKRERRTPRIFQEISFKKLTNNERKFTYEGPRFRRTRHRCKPRTRFSIRGRTTRSTRRLSQKKPPFRRESYATRTAAQEVHANFILQVCPCRLKRRLRHPKLRGCLGKFQRFTNRQKVSQMAELHLLEVHHAEKAWRRKQRGIGEIENREVRKIYDY
jgi:hypothetical protein